MEKLIEALQIFLKYKNAKYPTDCEHDALYIMEINIADVSEEDIEHLKELHFFWCDMENRFVSFHYGYERSI